MLDYLVSLYTRVCIIFRYLGTVPLKSFVLTGVLEASDTFTQVYTTIVLLLLPRVHNIRERGSVKLSIGAIQTHCVKYIP